jgi:hypothetical protein
MAEHDIYLFSLNTTRGSGYNAGYNVSCKWDDVAGAIKVYLSTGFFDPSPVLQTSGPSLGLLGVGPSSDVYGPIDTGYKFCTGTTLSYFGYNVGVFPYAILQTQAGSIACSGAYVCDLGFQNNPIIIPASNSTVNNGSFTVSATSSNGIIKYGLNDFDYATQGQTSGLFTAKYAGSYTVYAKDFAGCVDTITVTVPISTAYGVHYRSEWKDSRARLHRVDIYESGYVGLVVDIKAAGEPAVYKLNADGDDRFSVIRASEFRFRAFSSTNFQYNDLYTEDGRQFRVEHSIDTVLEWLGYLEPLLLNEPYIDAPYDVEIIATDGLASLKELDFLDASENRFYEPGTQLNFITAILSKLGLSINLRSGINEYEDSMPSTATDDPLMYAAIKPNVYYSADGTPAKCDAIVTNILKEYRAAICQADGVWTIYRPEETVASFDYREFDLTGEYVSNGSIYPIAYLKAPIESNRLEWVEESGNMSVVSAYGKFVVKQLLNKKISLFPSYGFEPHDVVRYDGNTFFFSGWSITMLSIPGSAITWGVEDTNRGDSQSAMFISFAPWNDSSLKEVQVFTIGTPIQFISGDQIKFGFDYFIGLSREFPWVDIQYKVKIGSYYLSQDDIFSTTDEGYKHFYATNYNQWQTFSKTVDSPSVSVVTDSTAEFYIIISNGAATEDAASLKAITGYDVGDRYVVSVDVDTTTISGYYELERGTDAENSPTILRPDDFVSSVWRLKGSNNGLVTVQKFMLDNAILEYLPGGEPTPEFQESSVTVNPNNKRTHTTEIQHGDYPTGITNAANAYDSNITYNGVPTSVWKRDNVTEGDKIQNVMLKSNISQFQKSRRRLQGNLISNGPKLRPYSCIIETMDSDRKYQMQGFEVEYKEETYTVDMYELKDVTETSGGGTSSFSGAFDPAAFGVQFD